MKKIFVYAAVAALAMTALSCQKESLNENGNLSNGGLVFTASIDAGMDTKTTLTSEKKVNWENGDEITINGVVYTAAQKSDATKADFTKKNSGDTDPTGTFNAFYPTGIQDGVNAGGTLPATQTYAAEKVTNLPMFATSMTTSLSFKNICAVLAVTVKNADFPSVKSIKVSSSNKALSGAFTVSGGNTAVLTDATTVANTVVLNCETAVTTAAEGTVFYIAVPAQTYQNLKIELSSDGSSYPKSMTTEKDVDIETAVNKIYNVTFKEDITATVTAKIYDVYPNRLTLSIKKSSNTSYYYLYEGNGMVGTGVKYTSSSKTLTYDFLSQGTTYYYTIAPYDANGQLGKVEIVSAETGTLSYDSYFYYQGDYHKFTSATMNKETQGNANWKNLRLNTSNGLCFVKFSYCVPYIESLSKNWSDGTYEIESSGSYYHYIGYFNDGSSGLQYAEGTLTIKTVNKIKIISFTLYDQRYRKLVGYFYGLK